jgi:hypothetical protein
MINTVQKWKKLLNLNEWDISLQRIDSKQVKYPNDCTGDEKYFIGIEKNHTLKKGTIYHDIDLYEEAIVHELLHVKHPTKSESWVNYKTNSLIKKYE